MTIDIILGLGLSVYFCGGLAIMVARENKRTHNKKETK